MLPDLLKGLFAYAVDFLEIINIFETAIILPKGDNGLCFFLANTRKLHYFLHRCSVDVYHLHLLRAQ